MRMLALRVAVVAGGLGMLMARPAAAQVQPNDVLATGITNGNVYIITAGGNFATATPFATVAPDAAYGICVRPSGQVLVVGVNQSGMSGQVYDITNGTPSVFASGFLLPVSLSCRGNEVILGDANGAIHDISAGGNFMNATPLASGIDTVGVFRASSGTLWATHYDTLMGTSTTYGVFDITAGGNFAGTTPFATGNGDEVAITEFGGNLLVTELNDGRVTVFGAGGNLGAAPVFATLPNVLGIAASPTNVFAGTINGDVYDITAGGDFTNGAPFATGISGGCYGLTVATSCGDGMTQPPEDCDDMGESATCDVDCTLVSCGDSVVNMTAGEDCDDGAESATCNADCTTAACGDGVLNTTAGETCDDGAESATCNADCSPAACGDGVVNMTAGEDCDDMGESATCNADCSAAACGDGILNATAGEICDDGAETATCNDDCSASACGDGVLNLTAGETCDDGNILPSDGCDELCQDENAGAGGGGMGGAPGTGGAGASGGTGGSTSTASGGSSGTDGGGEDGGCGCRAVGAQPSSGGAWLAALLGLGLLRRRRRRA